jgi:hypothetical protein
MNDHMGPALQPRHADLLALTVTAAFIALTASGGAGSVLAQNNPPPAASPQTAEPRSSISQDRMEAPVGHRQPRPQDLPPSVQRDEGSRTPAEQELDDKLQICRGC